MSRNTLWALVPVILVVALGALYLRPVLELYRLEHANPVPDARRAIARGDRRVAAVEWPRVELPGADSVLGEDGAFLCHAWSVSRYTSDVWDELTSSINGAARNYAKAYNLELLRDGKGCTPISKPAA